MITWLLLVSFFSKSTQDGNGQDNGVLHCGPQNQTVTTYSQMIHVSWEDQASCSTVQDVLIYEVVVLIADKQVHSEEVTVTPDQIGSTHSWNWSSYIALECASVKLRARYKNHTSLWKQERTLPVEKISERPQIFPKDRELKVGSNVTFCCILPEGQVFHKMFLSGHSIANNTLTKINNQIYDLTVHLNQASEGSCTNVECESKAMKNGACAYIGYPPQDSNLQCETRDLKSVECHWTVGRKASIKSGGGTEYHLLGSPCNVSGSCSKEAQVDVGERTWTLTAQNKLGKVELLDTADLTKRVHMFAPQGVTASTVNARNVSLKWEWRVQQYSNLSLTCQVNIIHGEEKITSEIFGVGLNFAVLNDLLPNWTYNVTFRCGTAQHFWKWSDWSQSVTFHTYGDVPDALDVWMQMKDNQIITIWKMPLANQSHGEIMDYEVTWTKTTERGRQNRTKVAPNSNSLALSLDTTEEYIISVTARNINGSSSPSTITINSLSPDRVNTSWIIGSNSSFNVSWSASPAASCGYIVDWCPTLGRCIVEWLKVPPTETNAIIFSKNFKDGVRYSLSIYACTPGAPVLLERREGYVREEKIQGTLFKSFKVKQQDSDYVVHWDRISLREQTAFIQGYILYCFDSNQKVISFSTDDPEANNLTAKNLKIDTYTFTVKAKTAVGEAGTATITTSLNSTTDNLISAVLISLVTVFGLLSLIAIVCYRHWTCMKQAVYPPIPKPVLISTGEYRCHPLHVDLCHHSEAETVNVVELHCSTGAPLNGDISQENMPFVYRQTLKGYYNQPLKKNTPPPLHLLTSAVPSQPALPSSPFRSMFPNPLYNLMMQPGNQQEGTSLEPCSDGYQPQGHTETFPFNLTEEDQVSPISCISTYVLIPKSPSS